MAVVDLDAVVINFLEKKLFYNENSEFNEAIQRKIKIELVEMFSLNESYSG